MQTHLIYSVVLCAQVLRQLPVLRICNNLDHVTSCAPVGLWSRGHPGDLPLPTALSYLDISLASVSSHFSLSPEHGGSLPGSLVPGPWHFLVPITMPLADTSWVWSGMAASILRVGYPFCQPHLGSSGGKWHAERPIDNLI